MKTELRYGLIFTVAQLAWLAFEHFIGLQSTYIHLHPYLTFGFAIIAVYIMVQAINAKKAELDGRISWGQAFLSGMIVSAVVALLAPLVQWIFHTYINPNFFADMINFAVKNGMGSIEKMKSHFNLQSYMMQGAIGAIFMGAITSAIVGYFVQTRK